MCFITISFFFFLMKSSGILLLMLSRYPCCGCRSFNAFYVCIISTCFFLLQKAAKLEDIGLHFQKNKNIQSAPISEVYHCIWHETQRAVSSALVPSPQQRTRWWMLWKISRNPWHLSAACSPHLDQLKEHVASEKAYLVILITSTRYPYLQDFITGIM